MSKKLELPKRICMVIEGTYPYVSGGVATWIHQIISKLEEFEFYLIVLLAREEDAKEKKYDLPKNIKGIYHIFLQNVPEKPFFLPKKFYGKDILRIFLDNPSYENFKQVVYFFSNTKIKKNLGVEALYSFEAYKLIEFIYEKLNANVSFINYFWVMRSLSYNLVNVFGANPPKGKIIHTISTGFAGLLAAVMKIENPNSKLMLTEHGIYTRERDIEISVGVWPDTDPTKYLPEEGLGPLKEIWRSTFFYLSKVCYNACDQIITLHEKNRSIQIEQGAPPEKTMVIRNGINLNRYRYRHREKVSDPPIIGFLGRIVKIKDVKSLIRAAKIVIQKRPDTIFKIAGPYDEDPKYFEECKNLVKILLIEKNVKFLGPVNAAKFFEEIDILVLSSISEGQPLVIAEAASSGVPSVATDVGGCREMLYGGGEDKLGQSGIIAEQGNVEDIANGILTLIYDDNLYSHCSKIGRLRAEKFYNEEVLLTNYRNLYNKFLSS